LSEAKPITSPKNHRDGFRSAQPILQEIAAHRITTDIAPCGLRVGVTVICTS
jgi:hypothetical protein